MKPLLDRLSSLSLIVLFVLPRRGEPHATSSACLGTGGILAGLLLSRSGFGAGWLLGRPGRETRRCWRWRTAQRNIAAALVAAAQASSDPNVVVMVVVVAIVGLVVSP